MRQVLFFSESSKLHDKLRWEVFRFLRQGLSLQQLSLVVPLASISPNSSVHSPTASEDPSNSGCLGLPDLYQSCVLERSSLDCNSGFVLCSWNGVFMMELGKEESYLLSR